MYILLTIILNAFLKANSLLDHINDFKQFVKFELEPILRKELHNITPDYESTLDIPELIRYHGYPAEGHTVTTADGYILQIHRIPHVEKEGEDENNRKPIPVFLQHGIMSASDMWVMNYGNQSLAYKLAEAGYDVWMGNLRGNYFAHEHTTMSSENPKYFEFNFDHMAKYDLPTMIDYVLQETGSPNLELVAHSMGTTVTFAMLASKPEYQRKIKLFIAEAPVAFLTRMQGSLNYLNKFTHQFKVAYSQYGLREFFPPYSERPQLAKQFCSSKKNVCPATTFAITGTDYGQYNKSREAFYFSHLPHSVSIQVLFHFQQILTTHEFKKYDYGRLRNLKEYGRRYPPFYDVSKITNTPVVLIYGLNDYFSSGHETKELLKFLPNVAGVKRISYRKWAHTDFMWAVDAEKYLHNYVESMLNKYQ